MLNQIFAQEINPIKLSWLGDNAPVLSTGVSWGVPLTEGKYDTTYHYSLKNENGKYFPAQSWPLAYWPDGSIKWIGLSAAVDSNAGSEFELEISNQGSKVYIKNKIDISINNDFININTGPLQCKIPQRGKELISSIKLNEKEISSSAKLISIVQNGPANEYGTQPLKRIIHW
ncbi:MAG: hypothetical protein H6613_03505 [Ignavibacteriales bacterium]|nr:hypothetical protein [Ignavibacteriales bacterium]